jgi:uncharacterized membrane protein
MNRSVLQARFRKYVFLFLAVVGIGVCVGGLVGGTSGAQYTLAKLGAMMALIFAGLWVDRMYRKSFSKLQAVKGRKGRRVLLAALCIMLLSVIGVQVGQFVSVHQLVDASRWLAVASVAVLGWWIVVLVDEIEANRRKGADANKPT